MTTNAAIGYGRKLQILDNNLSPPAFVSCGEITAVNGPSFAADALDATHMESDNRFREFIEGLRDAGELSGEINYIPGDAGMLALWKNLGRKATFMITEPSGFGSPPPTFQSVGIMTAFEVSGAVGDKMTASFTIKLSGEPTITGMSFV